MMRWHVREAFALAGAIAARVRAGRACLVTCQQGRNRSGLVAALALSCLTGAPGATSAEAVRARRASPFGEALTNREFVGLLRSIPPKARPGIVTKGAAVAAGLR
jgi:protein-tyrosine phosphatase